MNKRILYIVEDDNVAQFRYRVKNIIETCRKGCGFEVDWVGREKARRGEVNFGKVDIVIILRQTDKDGAMGKFIELAHEAGVKVLFDLDDLIFDYRDLPELMWATKSRNVFYWAGYFWGIRRIAKRVDGFICTNEFLAGKLKRSFGKPAKVIPNSLNREQVEASEKWIKKKEDRKKFSIGYFSGSPTHARDFRLVEDELMRFLQNHNDACIKVVGYMKFSDGMQKMVDEGRVEVVGVVDYLRLLGLMSEVDVNIAPLVVNDFTNCKSELKFFEAAVVEATTIASPAYAFKKAISDRENGFLAQPGEWYDKLEYLYEHPEVNKKIAKCAREYALKHYCGKEFLKSVEEAYGYFAK